MHKYILFIIVMLVMVIGTDCGPISPPSFRYIKTIGAEHPSKTISIWADKNFGEADRVEIDDAISQWNFALNGVIQLRVISYDFDMEPEILSRVMVKGDGWLFLKISGSSTFIHDSQGATTLAFVNEVGGNRLYIIRDRVANEWVRGVVMHEIGHLLGATHDNIYLMGKYYNFTYYRCIDEGTIKMVAEYEHIPVSKLNYCIYEERLLNNK